VFCSWRGAGRLQPLFFNATFQESIFNVSVLSNEPAQTGDFPLLENSFSQDRAMSRYCPLSMGADRTFCFGSGCMAWQWIPGQRDARTARGRCGLVTPP
jgi:hypothetical protein